jgi:excisionase family DNA binding protein
MRPVAVGASRGKLKQTQPDEVSCMEQRRFLELGDVAEELSISFAQVYALVRRGDLPAIKIGGRGQWRVERARLEDFIARMYAETADFIRDNPFVGSDTPEG